MEKSKLDWKTFTARRHLDVASWIGSKGFKTYLEMKKWLEERDMEPPTKEEVAKHFTKKKAKVEKVEKDTIIALEEKEEATKETVKKRSKKKVEPKTEE